MDWKISLPCIEERSEKLDSPGHGTSFVQLGMTDDTYTIEDSENMSYRDFTNLFLAYSPKRFCGIKAYVRI